MTPEEIQSRILYRDELMLIINKPAGVPVHAGSGGGENLEMYLEHLRFGLPQTPHLAHRLDRDTSGCLILGRKKEALRRIGKLFQEGRVEKTYWAIVEGTPPEKQGVIDLPLAKKTQDKRRWQMKVDEKEGQPSVTHYTVLGAADGLTWLELKPQTGRTHQLRVHCAHLGFPIAGDSLYGRGEGMGSKLHLHARAISVPLYSSNEPVSVEAPPPPHMERLLSNFPNDE